MVTACHAPESGGSTRGNTTDVELLGSMVPQEVAGPADPAHPATYLNDLSVELAKDWPQNRTINIVCHGHSVPAGYFHTPVVDTFNAYPHLLHRALKELYPHAVINIITTAIGGENSSTGAPRFAADVLTHRPDLITIDYALNDRRSGVEKARASLESMLAEAKAAGIPVILLTPTYDLRVNIGNPEDSLNLQANMVREVAHARGVGLVDSLATFLAEMESGTPAEDLMSGVNHPNRRGHDLVVVELMKWFTTER